MIKVEKVLSGITAGLSNPAISRHIVQSITRANSRLPSEASGSKFGVASQLMRATLAQEEKVKHRCNTCFTGFSLFSTRFYPSEAEQSRPTFSNIYLRRIDV
jgi:hypothetical protein